MYASWLRKSNNLLRLLPGENSS
uniref:Uncharacterized protein n=1 Tax=Arundo donax TaxID=35708 RepID=A0A0A8YUE1_ARUDO